MFHILDKETTSKGIWSICWSFNNDQKLRTVKCVDIPVNMDNFHCVLMSVHIDPCGFQLFLYDPMCDDFNLDHLEII